MLPRARSMDHENFVLNFNAYNLSCDSRDIVCRRGRRKINRVINKTLNFRDSTDAKAKVLGGYYFIEVCVTCSEN